MSPDPRTRSCTREDAKKRLRDAREFQTAAELHAGHDQNQVVVSNAVLAGIAASDAACCAALGENSRSPDHRDAKVLLEKIGGGEDAARSFGRLISLKDKAQYGFAMPSGAEARQALRLVDDLIGFAERIVN